MSDIEEALSRIRAGLVRLGRRVTLEALQPGLTSAQTGLLLKAAGLPEDEHVEVLYAWRDGTRTAGLTLDDIQIFPGFYLLSLQDAIANYRAFLPDPRWSPGWLPLFANGGGDFYLVDLGDQSSGSVRHFRIDESEHPIEYRSLVDMVATLAAGFDRGVFFVDKDGYLEMDDLRFAAVAAELNPNVPWWTD